MGQPTNPVLQRLGRAQLWPRLSAVSARSSAYADQQFKSQLSSRLICLLFAYGIITLNHNPWSYLFRKNRSRFKDYSLKIPAIYGIGEDARQLRNLYYSYGVWYEGRYVYWDDRSRRTQRYTGLHWGNVRVINLCSSQLYLLRGLTTTFAIGAERDNLPVWNSKSTKQDSLEDESAALAAWTRAVVSNWNSGRLQEDITLGLLKQKQLDIDTRSWL